MPFAEPSRSRASRCPVSVVVDTKMARSGNSDFRPSIRGFAARTSPTETACTQIAPALRGSLLSQTAAPLADASMLDGKIPRRSRRAPECPPRRQPRKAKYGASTNMPTAVTTRYRKYIGRRCGDSPYLCLPGTSGSDSTHKAGIIVAASGNMHNFPRKPSIEITSRDTNR